MVTAFPPTHTVFGEDNGTRDDDAHTESSGVGGELTGREIEQLRRNASEPNYWEVVRDAELQQMKAIYAGKISAHAEPENMAEHAARMKALMAEWNPVRCQVKDVLELAGKPTRKQESRLIYVFDLGYGGYQWEFEYNEDQMVVAVALKPMQ